MRASDRTCIAMVFSVLLSTFTITPLTEDSSFLGPSWLLILILGAATAWMRRNRVGSGMVFGVQMLILAAYVAVVSARLPGAGEPWYWHVPDLWQAGIEHMRTQAAPMEPNDGVKLIFVTVTGVIMIMTDLLVSGINRPVWAIAPPATLFLVPAIGLGTDTGIGSFLCIAVGYLAILIAEGLNTTARWTRGLTRDSAEGFGTAMPVVWRAASYLGLPALAAVLVLGLALPTLTLNGFGFGNGPGNGGPLQLTDPTLDLRRNLTQPNNREVIEYQTNSPGGVYLRLTSLPQFSSTGWSSVQIKLSSGAMPGVPGVTNEPADKRTTTVKVLDFRSQYLPLPYAPRAIDASGDWRYDANSLIVVNGNDRPDALRNLSYSATSVDVVPDAASLNKALAGTPADSPVTAAIPRDLPDSLIKLSRQVTADAKTPAGKAAAIQAYLRSSRFTYSTEPQPGSGYQALENFLLNDRTGYCEQFATSMAMMARVVGIPSRVSVGFLPGHQNGDRWVVNIRDMHAWPELYFAGYGWVRYEPTPASVTGVAPPWSVPDTSGGTDEPTDSPSQSSSTRPGETAAPSTGPTDQPTTTSGPRRATMVKTLVGGGVGLLVLLVLAAPATIRIRRRTGRYADDLPPEEQVESAWAEIRDTVLDYGGTWPDGSPRAIGREVGEQLDGEDLQAMSQVATLVERSRYARRFTDVEAARELPTMTEEIRRGIAAPQPRLRQIMAFVWPRSLFRRRSRDD
jgi:transglutaminase-like putative cysteine protease